MKTYTHRGINYNVNPESYRGFCVPFDASPLLRKERRESSGSSGISRYKPLIYTLALIIGLHALSEIIDRNFVQSGEESRARVEETLPSLENHLSF